MAEFSKLVITRKGQKLIAKMLAGQGDIEFSKISASNASYEVEQLDALEELPDVKQTNKISKITRTNEVAVKVETAFSNTELTEGYYMRTLGLYAIDPDDGEILYAVTTETTGNCYMPAYNGVTVSGAYVQLVSTVGNAENVSIKIDQAAIATIGNIQDLQDQINKMLGNNPDGSGLEFAEGLDAKNIVDAINKVFLLGNENKNGLVENLVAMGIDASTDETWGQLIDKVLAMTNTSGDTVTPAVLLAGYTAHDATGEQISGDMPERAGTTVDASAVTQDATYTYFDVPPGHYDAASKVRSANSNLELGYKLYATNVSLPWTPPAEITDYIIIPRYISCYNVERVTGNNGSATANVAVHGNGSLEYNNGSVQIAADDRFRMWCGAFNGDPSFSINFTRGDIYVKTI